MRLIRRSPRLLGRRWWCRIRISCYIFFLCNTGFVLDGPVSYSCTAEGEWRQPPPASNKIRTLGSLWSMLLIFPWMVIWINVFLESDSQSVITCNTGIALIVVALWSTGFNGITTWNWPNYRCLHGIKTVVSIVECDSLDAPRDGSVDDDGAEFGLIADCSWIPFNVT